MRIVVRCQCGQKIGVKEKFAGRKVACPKCKQPILVPTPAKVAEPEPDLLSEEQAFGQESDDLFQPEPTQSPEFHPGTAPVAHAAPGPEFSQPSAAYAHPQSQPSQSTGRSGHSVTGIITGVLLMIAGLLHLLTAMGMGLFIFAANAMANSVLDGADPRMQKAVSTGFHTGMMFVYLIFAAILVFSLMQISGSVGLFCSKLFGWILSVISAGLTFVFSCFLAYSGYRIWSDFSVGREAMEKANLVINPAVANHVSSQSTTLYVFAVFYFLFAIGVIALLCNGPTIRHYFKK